MHPTCRVLLGEDVIRVVVFAFRQEGMMAALTQIRILALGTMPPDPRSHLSPTPIALNQILTATPLFEE
jgi:hypothetical protein|tara:strand:- start:103 stop:309 length:207 start_codon:yes stop_codon:yes gene_type:complete